jgi:hypothetical protein
MTRRELLRLSGSSLLYAGLSPLASLAGQTSDPDSRRIFFTTLDLPRIRANARTPLLGTIYREWAATPPSELAKAIDAFEASGNFIRDFLEATRLLGQSAVVQLVEPSQPRQDALIAGIRRIIAAPYWDYFRDGKTEVIGIQRASFTLVRILFAREVLGDAIDPALDRKIMRAVAEKGCLPCYRTVFDMDHPEMVTGWDFDEQHAGFYDVTMERWPTILGANNLRAAPTGALGIGALALLGKDERAERWLQTAVASTKRFLKLFTPDGSYFEGLSYLSYCLRTTLPFMQAHRNLVGDVDWLSLVNFDGMLDYIMTMQFGKREDGWPDIVNFSDARNSITPGAASLIGEFTGNALAGYIAKEASIPQWYYDFLWYRPDAPAEPPRPALKNMRNDLNWIICRSGWKPEDAVVAFKSGGPANHEHADRNHIMFKSHGERLLNDHLGASYDRRNEGWKMRFTRAHNAVLLNGKSHPYIEGLEGTNDSQAYANFLQYVDKGDHVWWTSDASAAYILGNYHATQVLRTVIFAKPDVLVVIDQIRFRYIPQTVDARFYPDNADSKASLSVYGDRFVIARPKARLHGLVASDTAAAPREARLEVSADVGDFPCVEVHSPEALDHHIVTVLCTAPATSAEAPDMKVEQKGDNWTIRAHNLNALVKMKYFQPEIEIL